MQQSSSSSSASLEERRQVAKDEHAADPDFAAPMSVDQSFTSCIDSDSDAEATSSEPKQKIMSLKLASALDAAKVSDRQATRILVAACESFGIDPNSVVVSRSSIRRFREESRAQYAETIRRKYGKVTDKAFIVHWDGKLLPCLTVQGKVDRLPVIVTAEDNEILLGVPELESGSGQEQAEAVFECLQEWGFTDLIQGICCDTEAANTGVRNGACTLLEEKIGRHLIYFMCRHHIPEILLKSAFEVKFGKTTGPSVPFFKKFQDEWASLDSQNYEPGINDPHVKKALKNKEENILVFLMEKLNDDYCREDYREILELAVIFLGGIPKRGIFFRRPGAMHQARWMAKAIYCLKMFLLRKEYLMSPAEESACGKICVFLVLIYIKYWVEAPRADKAPVQDLQLIKDLQLYAEEDREVSETLLNKMKNHLWYLTPQAAALAFFDDELVPEKKNLMRKALKTEDQHPENLKRLPASSIHDILTKNIDAFISKKSKDFFTGFQINTSFLSKDANLWKTDVEYQQGATVVRKLEVINDVAERGIKLISDFNSLLTRDESQKQYLLQVVTEYRKQFPDCSKSTLSSKML